ncbi:MAG: glycosyltransferase family 9 protein [Melioribacteraceae bacterium]|nr:glycosyltransferase family 9 protein [Melioribacteraceae bacterium]
MSNSKPHKKIITKLIQILLAAKDTPFGQPNKFKRVLIIRQHNQFGDMLASVSLFRAVKETYPNVSLTIIASPENYFAIEKNNLIDELVVFDKKNLKNPLYIAKFWKTLRRGYDFAIVPATVAISNTSCILAALSRSTIKFGPLSLGGIGNPLAPVFNFKIKLDWKNYPDAHVSEFILDIVRPFGISTKNYLSSINFDRYDKEMAEKFISTLRKGNLIIGLHVGAGKPQNRWDLENFTELIKFLQQKYSASFYFTGSSADREQILFMKNKFGETTGYFINKTIAQLAAVISLTDIFITNDTGVMHVAGATDVAQISLFGPTNPFNWAPIGKNKFFLRKSDFVNDITTEDVVNLIDVIRDSQSERKY